MVVSSLIFWSWGTRSLNDGEDLDVALFSNSEASQGGTVTQDTDQQDGGTLDGGLDPTEDLEEEKTADPVENGQTQTNNDN